MIFILSWQVGTRKLRIVAVFGNLWSCIISNMVNWHTCKRISILINSVRYQNQLYPSKVRGQILYIIIKHMEIPLYLGNIQVLNEITEKIRWCRSLISADTSWKLFFVKGTTWKRYHYFDKIRELRIMALPTTDSDCWKCLNSLF